MIKSLLFILDSHIYLSYYILHHIVSLHRLRHTNTTETTPYSHKHTDSYTQKMRKKGKNLSKKHGQSKLFSRQLKGRRRTKDLDELQTEIANYDPSKPRPIDQDLPGLGQWYCLACG